MSLFKANVVSTPCGGDFHQNQTFYNHQQAAALTAVINFNTNFSYYYYGQEAKYITYKSDLSMYEGSGL